MKFASVKGATYEGLLVYRASEYSLDFVESHRSGPNAEVDELGMGSLSIGTLQLELSIGSGEILFPWGLFPSSRWKEQTLSKPDASPGRVIFLDAPTFLKRGVSLSIPDTLSHETRIDRRSGWIHIGNAEAKGAAIEFASNAILVLKGQDIVGLWLKPVFD